MTRVMSSSLLRAAILPVGLLVLWQLIVTFGTPSPRAPMPSHVVSAAWELIGSGDLPLALIQSFGRVLAGFAWAAAFALVLGALMGTYRAVDRSIDPLVESFRSIAPIALLPLAILWFGTGTPAAAFIVGYAAFFPMIVNTIHGVKSVDPQLVRAARTLGVDRLTILRTGVLPGALPYVFVGARVAHGVAWTSIIAAELAVGAKAGGGSTGGIGQMMFVFYAYSVDLNGIIVCMISVGVVALVIDRGLRRLEQWMLPWKR
jgi:ABC-type nitrate/sulfonate/bicarbonate transport system permease component